MAVDDEGKELDRWIVALAQSIREYENMGVEGGEIKGEAVAGASGEIPSRYQFLQSTWDNLSKKHLGDRAGEQPTDETEREVVYKELKRLADGPYSPKEKRQLKAMGQTNFNVGNIASIWNRGLPEFHLHADKFDKLTGRNPNKGKGSFWWLKGKKVPRNPEGNYKGVDIPEGAKEIKFDTGQYVTSVHGFYKRNIEEDE
jgi:hypothetical protein